MDWVELKYLFHKHVGDRHYANVLLKDALATVGLGPDETPREDRYLVIQMAKDMYESGKKIRREAFHQPYGPHEWQL